MTFDKLQSLKKKKPPTKIIKQQKMEFFEKNIFQPILLKSFFFEF